MNNKIFFLVVFVLLTSSVSAILTADGSKIDVSLISQDADPVNPGEVVTLRFKVENFGSSSTDNIEFEFINDYPLTVYSGESLKSIGSLQALQRDDEGIIVLYEIKVDEEAVQGTHLFDIRYKHGRLGSWITVKDFPLRIRTRDLVVSVDSLKSSPELISPGEDFDLSFTIRNNADSLIRDVVVQLDLSGSDTPFAPSKSTTEKQIYQIKSNSGKIVNFDLLALPDADGGIFKIPLNISYTDETGVSYRRSDIISLKVSSPPDLLATVDSSEISGDIKSGTLTFRIVNRGLTNIKLLTAEIQETNDFVINSEPEVYVGNIDSDDWETVDFDISLKSFEKSVVFPLKLSYRDSTNKLHTEDLSINFKTGSKSQLVTILIKAFNLVIFVVVIIGIVFGVRWFLKRRKRKRKG